LEINQGYVKCSLVWGYNLCKYYIKMATMRTVQVTFIFMLVSWWLNMCTFRYNKKAVVQILRGVYHSCTSWGSDTT